MPDKSPRIRVFNPRFEDHGWQSTHTVVEVLAKDSSFLVDTVVLEVVRRGLSIHSVMTNVFWAQRNERGELQNFSFGHKGEGQREALIHVEFDRQPDTCLLADITRPLQDTLHELSLAVQDFPAMQNHTIAIAEQLKPLQPAPVEASLAEVKNFLSWLVRNNFTFLAMQEYVLVNRDGVAVLEKLDGSTLGVAKVRQDMELLEAQGGPLLQPEKLIVFGKSGSRSRWHRPVYMDFIGVRKCNDAGEVIGEYRWLGLYTSLVFNNSPRDFPIIGHKLRQVLEGSGLEPTGHDGKRLMQILETFPREELFQTSTEDLLKTAVDKKIISLKMRILKIIIKL